jgi:hypothetical protein
VLVPGSDSSAQRAFSMAVAFLNMGFFAFNGCSHFLTVCPLFVRFQWLLPFYVWLFVAHSQRLSPVPTPLLVVVVNSNLTFLLLKEGAKNKLYKWVIYLV